MTLDTWPKGRLTELDEDESRHVLDKHSVGRIAWCGPSGPRMVPVNFVMAEQRLWIRSAPYSQLARESPGARVAFEVDDIDDFTRSGTSVIVHGIARHEDPSALRQIDAELEPWPEGQRSMVISIELDDVSGRRLLPS